LKQILQNLSTGLTSLEEIPAPGADPARILIRTRASLVSLGTERMLVEFGKANLIQKARQQPEKVKQVLEKIRADGLLPTVEAVFKKLDQPLPLGYCNAGVVISAGDEEAGQTSRIGQRPSFEAASANARFRLGDRVVSNGPHAEIVSVPPNLVARIPDNVSFEQASFAVIGAIGLQGIRLLQPTFGETVVVVGLGLVGQLTAQLLKAHGCRVIGLDFDQNKVELAASKGILAVNSATAGDPVTLVHAHTGEIGADAVIITATTKTSDVISQSARMTRKRGRIVLVGVVGLDLNRSDFYEKELTFQVSCSYGPGRYDANYEQYGADYPLPYVRWTENRNLQAVLEAISSGALDVDCLITERVALEDYDRIYGRMGTMDGSRSIASILLYPEIADSAASDRIVRFRETNFAGSKGVLAIIGAGNFTRMALLPALRQTHIDRQIKYIVSSSGVTGTALAKKYGIARSTTSYGQVLADPEVDAVVITTRHNLHAKMTLEAVEAGKHVFVEKPLCLSRAELLALQERFQSHPPSSGMPTLTVGFNRRFSTYSRKMKDLLGTDSGPVSVVATMNSGFIPADSWVHDLEIGGGRIVGEACHLIDLITYLTGSRVTKVCMAAAGENPSANTDTATILLKYADGSIGGVNYFSNGSKAYSKERVEVYSRNRTLVLDNFRLLNGFGFKGFKKMKTRQDKGHVEQFRLWSERIQTGGAPLISLEEIFNTTEASLAALESLQTGQWVRVGGRAT
jgi:predicted dehydrogenase/threonine dehydrogenase-like Zn-dependent dehydrogenase